MNTEIILTKISLPAQFMVSYAPRGASHFAGVGVLGEAGNAVVKPALTRAAFISASCKAAKAPTLAVQRMRSSMQMCRAPGTDIAVCHIFWAMPGRLPKIAFVPFKNPSKNLSVPAY